MILDEKSEQGSRMRDGAIRLQAKSGVGDFAAFPGRVDHIAWCIGNIPAWKAMGAVMIDIELIEARGVGHFAAIGEVGDQGGGLLGPAIDAQSVIIAEILKMTNMSGCVDGFTIWCIVLEFCDWLGFFLVF